MVEGAARDAKHLFSFFSFRILSHPVKKRYSYERHALDTDTSVTSIETVLYCTIHVLKSYRFELVLILLLILESTIILY